ncbi:zinc-binding dehydrogenase [Kineosporia sp. J2-2]|uniref:Zinc-binding dehydrogenase n=1 Tax=Kineosporia corallincola TaxID=2835133 RepID=A0ABS5TS69_9ACTN|nr:zinc-binding alcohol dehydrogenase family protein [Kineosporia corallincola]MBT0773656.1 zinc-binding dehydrogenase [Kineosporia corallincola]
MTETMHAVVLDAPGPTTSFHVRDVPLPRPDPGWVRIRVRAFGLNRSELMTRQGHSGAHVTFPRVLGIEATGTVDEDPSGTFTPGQQVMTMMGEMGRRYDGGYAEYTCVPVGQVIPFSSELDWATLGAVPEMLQTAYGSLTDGLDAQPGRSILIRGGTSSVGLATAVLARRLGMTVLSTTRNPARAQMLLDLGVDHVLIDDGEIARQVRAILPDGVDTAIELVGTATLPDTLRATTRHGVVCFTGMLANEWIVREFEPMHFIPRGVRLTAYSGEASDLPTDVLQQFLDDLAAGTAKVPIDIVHGLEGVAGAHARMEAGTSQGKLVVVV